MRVLPLLGVIVPVMLVGGCHNTVSDAVLSVPVDESFTLSPGESAVVTGAELTVTLLDVAEDSRCPTDVQCVWAGSAQVRVRTEHHGDERERSLESAGAVANGATRVAIGPYVLELVDVAPAPRTDRPIGPEAYRITFRVVASSEGD